MTGTLCQSLALACSIAPWVAMVAALFGIMIKTILAIVEKVGDNVQAASSRSCTAGWPGLPSLIWPSLSPPGLDMWRRLSAPGYPTRVEFFEGTAGKAEKKAGRFPPRKAL